MQDSDLQLDDRPETHHGGEITKKSDDSKNQGGLLQKLALVLAVARFLIELLR